MKTLRDYISIVESLNEAGGSGGAAQAQQAAASGQSATPAPGRYKTPAEYDAEIARFSKSSNPALAPNKRYIDTLNAEKAALMKQGATPAAPAAPKAAPKSDPAVLKIQQDLIAKGAKIKADGVMGPATQQAQKDFGGTQTQQNFAAAGMAGQEMRTQAEIDASKDMLSANNAGNINAGLTPDDPRWKGPKPTGQGATPAAPAAPAAAASPWANDPAKDAAWKALSPADQKWLGGADPTDPFILARAPNKGKPAAGAAPAAAPATPAAPAAAPAAPAAGQAATPTTPQNDPAMKDFMGESSFQNDELTRIVSLVQYR